MKKISLLIMLVAFFASVSFAQVAPSKSNTPSKSNNKEAVQATKGGDKLDNTKNNGIATSPIVTTVLNVTIDDFTKEIGNDIETTLKAIKGVKQVLVNKNAKTITVKYEKGVVKKDGKVDQMVFTHVLREKGYSVKEAQR